MISPAPVSGDTASPRGGGPASGPTDPHGFDDDLQDHPLANINDTARPAAELVRDALRNMGDRRRRPDRLGVSYREDGDTRCQRPEILVRKLTEMGADVIVHDPMWQFVGDGEAGHYPASIPGPGSPQPGRSADPSHKYLSQTVRGAEAVVPQCAIRPTGTDPDGW